MSIRLRDLIAAENAGGSVPPSVTTTPSLTSLAPATGVVGQSQTVTLDGAGFYPTTVAYADGVAYPTTYISSTQVRMTWTPPMAKTYGVVARNGSLTSASRNYLVTVSSGDEPTPTQSSNKAQIVAWLLEHGVEFDEDALNELTKAELLDLVHDLLDDETG